MQLSGHRNVQSVNNYNNANNNASRSAATTTLTAEAEASLIKTSMFPAAGPFRRTVFHGRLFKITINTVNKSPGDGSISTERSFKRIKQILESSDDDDSPPLQWKTLPPLAFLKILVKWSTSSWIKLVWNFAELLELIFTHLELRFCKRKYSVRFYLIDL